MLQSIREIANIRNLKFSANKESTKKPNQAIAKNVPIFLSLQQNVLEFSKKKIVSSKNKAHQKRREEKEEVTVWKKDDHNH